MGVGFWAVRRYKKMNVSMTVGDIIVSAVISLIAGVITGIITGYGVTIYYRNKDKKRDAGKYTKELLDFIAGLVKIMTYEGSSVPDYLKDMPIRYNWIEFTDEQEKSKIIEAEKYVANIIQLASSCMVSMLLSEKDEETQRKIENTKIKIFCEEEPKGMLHIIELTDILKKYR